MQPGTVAQASNDSKAVGGQGMDWSRRLLPVLLLPLPATAAGTVWTVLAGGWVVRWSDSGIEAGRAGEAPAYSARQEALADFRRAARDPGVRSIPEYRRTVSVVSLCGPLLGLREETYLDNRPAAHPAGQARLRTLDLRTGLDQRLDRLVNGAALSAAMGLPADADAADRMAALNQRALDLPPTGSPMDGCFSVPADWPRSFAATAIGPRSLSVLVGLPGAGPCRTALTELPIMLPRPATWPATHLVAGPQRPPLVLRHRTRP